MYNHLDLIRRDLGPQYPTTGAPVRGFAVDVPDGAVEVLTRHNIISL